MPAPNPLLFPHQSRDFHGKRWVNISLRTLHLIGIAGMGGHFLLGGTTAGWEPYFQLTLASGIALSLLALWSNGIWLLQLRGQAILLKILLLCLLPLLPNLQAALVLGMLLISGLIAHAPGNLRYYSLYHRRRLDSFYPGESQRDTL